MEEHTGDRDHGAGHYGGGSDAPQWASRERNSEGRAGRHVASGARRDRKMYQPGPARPDVIVGLESAVAGFLEDRRASTSVVARASRPALNEVGMLRSPSSSTKGRRGYGNLP